MTEIYIVFASLIVMMKKGTLDLSINILVIVIISMVILSSGIILLYKFIGQAEEIKIDLDQRTEDELERLLVDQGKQVALPFYSANLFPGDSKVFGLGILSLNNYEFRLDIQLSKAVDEEGNDITLIEKINAEKWLLYPYKDEILKMDENEHQKVSILVKASKEAVKGEYIFDVKILQQPENTLYGNVQKLVIKVE